jgi:putative ABC transport system ATP-binding protein
MEIMVGLNKELTTTFVFATHDEKIMAYLRRIIYLDDGQITEDKKNDNPQAGE